MISTGLLRTLKCVDMETNMVIGKTLTIDELFDMGYEAVFVGSGPGTGTGRRRPLSSGSPSSILMHRMPVTKPCHLGHGRRKGCRQGH